MRTFKEYLRQRLDEKDDGHWSAERTRFFNTYQGDNEQKAIQNAKKHWGSLSAFLHDNDDKKWARLWSMVRDNVDAGEEYNNNNINLGADIDSISSQ